MRKVFQGKIITSLLDICEAPSLARADSSVYTCAALQLHRCASAIFNHVRQQRRMGTQPAPAKQDNNRRIKTKIQRTQRPAAP